MIKKGVVLNISLNLKYYLLKVDPKKRMMFNPAESIELNGHTGPFIQYAHARIQSLLGNANSFKLDTNTEIGASEKEIIKQLVLYPSIIEEAAKTYAPSVVANYTYELVKLFNQFYQNVMILSETDENQKALAITDRGFLLLSLLTQSRKSDS